MPSDAKEEERQKERHRTRAGRWAFCGLGILGFLGLVGWGASFWLGAEVGGN